MNPIRKQRIYALIAILAGSILAVGRVISALSKNLNLFYSPTDLLNNNLSSDTLIRAGGMVREGSIKRSDDSLNIEFTVTDFENDLVINYSGILPDLFSEKAGVVVQGYGVRLYFQRVRNSSAMFVNIKQFQIDALGIPL